MNIKSNNYPIKITKNDINKKFLDISVNSDKNQYLSNSDKKNLILANNNIIKDKLRKNTNENSLSKEKRNVTNYSYSNINLLNIFKNKMVKKNNKKINEEQIDNSKNSYVPSSYSINFYNNNYADKKNNNCCINKYNKNENMLIKSKSGNINFQNNDNYNNNQNKAIDLINSYKYDKDKYTYIVAKKSNRDKLKKINNTTKSQSCSKIDGNIYKNNNKINNDSKRKYEKEDKNLLEPNIINSEIIFNENTNNSITPLKSSHSQDININQKNQNIQNNNFEKLLKKNKNLSIKQKSYYLLSTSPILRLKEQIIFSNADPIIKNNLSIPTILKNHEIFLENKINELNEEIKLCSDKINKPFIASKIADVTLNFITSLDEQEFKDFDIFTKNKEEIKLYYNLIKILYYLLDEQFDKNDDNKKIKNELFHRINEKEFKSLKDYLYFYYITNKKKINDIKYIEEINEITKNEPNIIDKTYFFRMNRFMAFSIYLVREIINYANNIKDTIELKIKTKQFLVIVIEKLNKIKNKNNNNIIKK